MKRIRNLFKSREETKQNEFTNDNRNKKQNEFTNDNRNKKQNEFANDKIFERDVEQAQKAKHETKYKSHHDLVNRHSLEQSQYRTFGTAESMSHPEFLGNL